MSGNNITEVKGEEDTEGTDGQQKTGQTLSELQRDIQRKVRMQREEREKRLRIQRREERKRLKEAEAAAARERAMRKADLDQVHELVAGMEKVIEDYGGSTEIPREYEELSRHPDRIERRFLLGYARIRSVLFPVTCDSRDVSMVSFAGMLGDEHGIGLNYIIARRGVDDISGELYVQHYAPSPGSSPLWPEPRSERWSVSTWHGPWEKVKEVGDRRFLEFLKESLERAGRKRGLKA